MPRSQSDQVLDLAREHGIIVPQDLDERGIPRQYLSRLAGRAELECIGRGLYSLPDAEITRHHDLAIVSKRMPRGVICLLSALSFHELTTQVPFEVWVAIASGEWEPKRDIVPLRTRRMSGAALSEGITDHIVEKVPIRVFVPAKTVADCFRFRSVVGLHVAFEALREFRRAEMGSIDELWRYAGICRVQNVMRPYLESVV